MKYTIDDMESDFHSFAIQECGELRKTKGHDYSGADEDNLSNLRMMGWEYVAMRVAEKGHRLINIIRQGGKNEVKDEAIEDTLKDITNMAVFAILLKRQEDSDGSDRT